jgi:hypothetical protein
MSDEMLSTLIAIAFLAGLVLWLPALDALDYCVDSLRSSLLRKRANNNPNQIKLP